MFDAFYSDSHFGHANIIEYAGRPYRSIVEHDRDLIDRYNAIADAKPWYDEEPIVLWLGDVALCKRAELATIMRRLIGRKVLIPGNHDRSPRTMVEMGFDAVVPEALLHIADRPVRCSHYPYRCERYPERTPKRNKGELLLHGHTHSQQRRNGNMIHVGVDAWDYGPAMYDDVAKLVAEVRA